MNEWEYLAADNNEDDEEITPRQFEMVRIIYQKTTAKALLEIATKLNIS